MIGRPVLDPRTGCPGPGVLGIGLRGVPVFGVIRLGMVLLGLVRSGILYVALGRGILLSCCAIKSVASVCY